jgi:hypothetical protein
VQEASYSRGQKTKRDARKAKKIKKNKKPPVKPAAYKQVKLPFGLAP